MRAYPFVRTRETAFIILRVWGVPRTERLRERDGVPRLDSVERPTVSF